MKKTCILLFVVIAFLSCESELDEDLLQDNTNTHLELEAETVSFTQDTIYIPAQNGKKISLLKYDENFYSWGDMLLNKEQVEILANSQNTRSVATIDLAKRWNNLTIPYRFHPSFSSVSFVRTAISRIRSQAPCFNFIELSSNQTAASYIEFRDINDPGIGGNSALGRQGGQQIININPTIDNFFKPGVIIHELGHALGLFHEQNRSDRNNSIIVNFQNIDPDYHDQFYIPTFQVNVGNFDFDSVMLYSSDAFSDNGLLSMTRLNGDSFTGQRINFRDGDYETVLNIHGFDFKTDPRLQNKSLSSVLIDYEASQDTQYREEEFYLNFSTNLTSPLTIQYEIVETVSNVQTHPSGQVTTVSNYTITLPPGQTSYLVTTVVTVDQNYDFGEPDGPQYTRSCNLFDYCAFGYSRFSK